MSWLLAGAALALAALAGTPRAHADTALCASGSRCEPDLFSPAEDEQFFRFSAALGRVPQHERSLRRLELSDQDYSSFSGVGVIVCKVNGKRRSATAFLVGAFDIGVTVAHTFEKDADGTAPTDCVYNSMDSLGQIRERIPVSYVRSQWEETDAAGQAAKDFAVIRLAEPSRYAQRTLPLGRFSGDPGPVAMVGFKADIDADTIKRKARGMVYKRTGGVVGASVAGFTHDMDSRGIADGAPVIDERTGVIIGMHTQPATSRNTMITMNDWLEATLRREIKAQTQAQAETQTPAQAEARPN